MVDHVRTLLLNPDGVPGYRHVMDVPSDVVMRLFGDDEESVDRVLPLAMAPDLATFRRFFDGRTTPERRVSIYARDSDSLSIPGLCERVLSGDGWWRVSDLFDTGDARSLPVLSAMRSAASSKDAPYALGAVLLACAYRRWLLQGGGLAE